MESGESGESEDELQEIRFCAQALYLGHICSENCVHFSIKSEESEGVVGARAASMNETRDDVGLRADVVVSIARIAEEMMGESAVVIGSANDLPQGDDVHVEACIEALDDSAGALGSANDPPRGEDQLPRVDPPEVEDRPGQTVREDTPGYIAKTVPNIFP